MSVKNVYVLVRGPGRPGPPFLVCEAYTGGGRERITPFEIRRFFAEGVLANRPGLQERRGRTNHAPGQLDHVHQGPSQLFATGRLSVLL